MVRHLLLTINEIRQIVDILSPILWAEARIDLDLVDDRNWNDLVLEIREALEQLDQHEYIPPCLLGLCIVCWGFVWFWGASYLCVVVVSFSVACTSEALLDRMYNDSCNGERCVLHVVARPLRVITGYALLGSRWLQVQVLDFLHAHRH